MQIFFLSIFAIIFCFINCKIIICDKKVKKIPNKFLIHLLILLPFWYIFLYFFPFSEINILWFFIQIIVSFLVSFLLFNFSIWRAWDAKYLLVLSLFIPYIWIIPFIWNLGLFTLLYLFLYFLWFFLWKSILYKWYAKSLLLSIKIDLQEKWKVYKDNKWWKSFWIIIKWIIVFLIIFVSLRLFRIYIFLELFNNIWWNWNLVDFIKKYHFYIIFASIWITILIFYFWKKIINYLKKFFALKFNINLEIITYILIGILFIFLIWFILFEYSKDSDEIINYLLKIFTIYIIIYIFLKIIFYSYKISFIASEEEYIDIKNLKIGDLVDKKYLHTIFSKQTCLWAHNYEEYTWSDNEKQKILEKFPYFLFIEPQKFFLNIKNPIDKETKKLLQNIYETSNKYLKENKKNYKFSKENYKIKILKTFSFGIYIFIWFIITIIFWNKMIIFITKKIIEWINF